MILEVGAAAEEALFNEEFLRWLGEAYGASGLAPSGFTLIVLFIGAIGLFNWTETFKVPAIWLAIVTPLVATTLPVPVVWRVLGIVTTGVALLFVGLYVYWNRI